MMTNSFRVAFAALGVMAGLACASGVSAQVYGQFKDPLPMIQRSVLNDPTDTTGVPEGRMGSIGYDPFTQCMYFAAPRSGAVIVLDPSGMSRIQILRDINEPMGIAVATDLRKLVLTCGDGSVKVYSINTAKLAPAPDGKSEPAGTLTLDKSVNNPGEADAVRYDSKSKKAFYAHGKFVSWIDPAAGEKSPKSLEMPGAPKGIVLDPSSNRMFVSIPSKQQIVVVDRDTWTIEATWQLKDASVFPMSIDEAAGKLFVCSRNPDVMLVLSLKDGAELARLPIGADAADCWWDAIGRRVYISCGGNQGQISMLRLVDGAFTVEHAIDTAPGARTSIFIPERRRYIVCAPKLGDAAQGGMPTFVYIYVLPNANEHNAPLPKSH
jgi:DNA-binding beta-propeller fold protein YncE